MVGCIEAGSRVLLRAHKLEGQFKWLVGECGSCGEKQVVWNHQHGAASGENTATGCCARHSEQKCVFIM